MTLRSDLGSFSWDERQFGLLRDLIHDQTGIFFANGQAELLAGKLAPLLAERRFNSFLDYYYLLKYDPEANEEWGRVASALAVNESFFWREVDQIKAVANSIVPTLREQVPDKNIRIWHAACASGEEPYSMVMALLEKRCFEHGSIEIVATDFNVEALTRARKGEFRARSFRSLPDKLRQRYFQPTTENTSQISESIRERVRFEQLNLADEQAMNQYSNFDIIFCRNVFIYFSKEAIENVVKHFHQALNPPGYLFVASAESLLRVTSLFELDEVAGAFVYRKFELMNLMYNQT